MICNKKLLTVFLPLLLLIAGCSKKIVSEQTNNGQPIVVIQSTQIIANASSPLQIADTLDSKGNIQFFAGNYENASIYYKQAFEIRTKVPDAFHTSLIDSLYNIATIHEVREQYNKAETSYKRAINILKQNKQTSKLNKYLGYLTAIQYQKNTNKTVQKLKNLVIAYTQIHDPRNIRMSAVKHRLANIYLKTKNYQASEKEFNDAMTIIQHYTGIQHPYYAIILRDYTKLLHLTKRKTLANKTQRQAISILNKFPKKPHTRLYKID